MAAADITLNSSNEALQEDPELLLRDDPKCIDHYMPQIFWHDRKQIMSVHIQQVMPAGQFISDEGSNAAMCYKICTASVQHEVRVWELVFCKSKQPGFEQLHELGVNFIANLVGHTSTLNLAMYSPNGEVIASGDVDGKLYIWRICPRDDDFVQTEDKPMNDESAQFEIPPNKENWLRVFTPIGHDSDLNALAFSPNSQFICTAANDDLRLVNTITGKQGWYNRNFRRLITGLAWDPLGRYIVSLSSDRRMDIVDAHRGHRLRTCYSHAIPTMVIGGKKFEERHYKFFFDQHVYTLTRSLEFSPCGELLFAPAGQLETADANVYGTYVFRRCDFDSCLPHAFFPCIKPTLMVSVAPVKYELREDTEDNFLGLPYRYVFAVMCAESIFFYDTQTAMPIGFVYDMSYDNLTSIAWAPDGRILAVSSLEGFNTFLHIRTDRLHPTKMTIERVMSPPLKKIKEPKAEEMDFSTPKSVGETTKRKIKTEPTPAVLQPTDSLVSSPVQTASKPSDKMPKRKISTFFKSADDSHDDKDGSKPA